MECELLLARCTEALNEQLQTAKRINSKLDGLKSLTDHIQINVAELVRAISGSNGGQS